MKDIIILTAYFIGRVLFDAWRIKRGKNVDHWFGAFVTFIVGCFVLGWDIKSNWALFKYMFVYLSAWWFLFDLTLNILRGLKWNYIGSTSYIDKILLQLQELGFNQYIFKSIFLFVSLLLLLYK